MLRIPSSSGKSFTASLSLFLVYALFTSLYAPFALSGIRTAAIASSSAARRGRSTSPAPHQQTPKKKGGRRDRELLARFRTNASAEDIDALLSSRSIARAGRLRGASRIEKLTLPAGTDPEFVAAELRTYPLVEFVEPNYLISKDDTTPNDPQFSEQWALHNTNNNSNQLPGADIGAVQAWDTATGSASTIVAVIDSGIDFTHPDLRHNQWTNSGEKKNNQDNDQDGFVSDINGWDFITDSPVVKDGSGHGTAIAGIIAAEGNNNIGITGVMWHAGLMSLRVLDNDGVGDVGHAVEAIDFAIAHNAAAINLSWGTDEAPLALKDAIKRAGKRNIIVVCSAGNDGRDIETLPYYPASFDLTNLIAVAAIDNQDQLTGWTNYGQTHVTMAAPGVDILTTKAGGGYQKVTGTSASAPLVTGLTGLVKTLRPQLSAARTKSMLTSGARAATALSGKVQSGVIASASGAVQAVTTLPPTEGLDAGSNTANGNNNANNGNNGNNGSAVDNSHGAGNYTGRPHTVPQPKRGGPGLNLPNLDIERKRPHHEPRAPASTHPDLRNGAPPPVQRSSKASSSDSSYLLARATNDQFQFDLTAAMGGNRRPLFSSASATLSFDKLIDSISDSPTPLFGITPMLHYGRPVAGASYKSYFDPANIGFFALQSPDTDTVWVEDAVPTGATLAGDGEGWNWINSNPAAYSGTAAHQSNVVAGAHQHYFYGATSTLTINTGDKLLAYVYLDPANMPSELMLQWNDGSWEHRAYWGANNINWGTDATISRRYMGPLPAAGQWIRLEVPASQVGLEGSVLNGMAFTLYGGRASWDHAGKSSSPNYEVYQASADFSSTQGQRNWYYLDASNNMFGFIPADNWWKGAETYRVLWSNGGHPGEYDDVVRQWRAPNDGMIRITGNASDSNPNCGDGVVVSIKKGNLLLWQQTIENGNTTGFSYDISTSVAAGDQLNFVINKRGDSNCDSTTFDPRIYFSLPSNTYQASVDFSAVQGQRNWFYMDSTGASMSFSPANNMWTGPYTCCLLLWSTGGHPGAEDAVRRWKAPQAGSVHMTGNVSDGNTNCGDGVIVSIKKGATLLWQQVIENGDITGVNYDLTTNVLAGDNLDFVINRRGDTNCDSTNFDPRITFSPQIVSTPFRGTPTAVPGRIEAEDFDDGGEGLAYHDADPINNCNTPYRATAVDICQGEGSYVLGYINVGEWLKYTVNVQSAGTYAMQARVANEADGGTFHIEFDGVDKTGPMRVPNTGWLGTFTTISVPNVSLTAGQHVMRVVMDAYAPNGIICNLNWFAVVNTTPPAGLAATTISASRIDLAWTDNASDETGYRIERKQGATGTYAQVGTVAANVAAFNDTNLAPGTQYFYRVRTIRAIGDSAPSNEANAMTDVPPSVSLTSSANGVSMNAPANVVVSANASDADGTISKVEFYQGTTLIGTATASPYTIQWNNVAVGNYTLTAKATDNLNESTISPAVSIRVNNPPSVNLTSPTNQSSFTASASISISANANDTDGTISKVDFYQGSTLLGTSTTAPYNFIWSNVSSGTYSLTAIATDNNNATTASSAVSVSVVTNNPPTVSLASPANNATYTPGSNITIGANASDADGSVSKVEFFQGTAKLGETAASPYNFTWSNVPAGNYSLTAKATDNVGGTTVSSTVMAIVTAPATDVENVLWTNKMNVTTSGNNITSTAVGWGNAGAVSTRSIVSGDGYVEFTTTDENNRDRMAGLGNGDTNQHYGDIEFAVYLNGSGLVEIYESGNARGTFGAYSPGDRFRVAVENGVVRYRKNGNVLYTSAVTPTYPLLLDTSFYGLNSTITDATIAGVQPLTGAINQSPIAIAGVPAAGTIGQPAQFDGSYSSDADGTITGYLWNFGDGATSTNSGPTHAYAAAGTYTVQLTVTDNGGAIGRDTGNITIRAGNTPPTANAGGPYTAVAGTSVSFNGGNSFDPDGQITSYNWYFGDGSAVGTTATPAHTYASAGTFTVDLTVTDNGGATSSATTIVTVATACGGTQTQTSEAFVRNFYQSTLNRQPAASELQQQTTYLQQGYALGQSQLLSAAQSMGTNLFASAEYTARSRTNRDYVYDLYKAYFQREPDQGGWDFWTGLLTNNSAVTRTGVRREFGTSPEFKAKVTNVCVATGAPSGNAASGILQVAQLDPVNRTGGGGEDPLSGNSNWGTGLLNLSGRAGLDLGLALSYNSHIWTKVGSAIVYDADGGTAASPAPGFRVGFPVIGGRYFNSEAGVNALLLTLPSGGHVELRQVGASNIYEAADSSYLQFDAGTQKLRTTDGTQLTFAIIGGVYQCTEIKDRNGNFISIGYTSSGYLNTITDTVGRVINFKYDNSGTLLESISQSWNGGVTHTWATFSYDWRVIQTNFAEGSNALAVYGPANGTSIMALTQVGMDDGSAYKFDYNSWGQVKRIARSTPDSDNGALIERSVTSYNLPLDNSVPQSNCPRFTERHDSAQNWTGANNVPAEVVTSFSVPAAATWAMEGGTSESGVMCQVTEPNGTFHKMFMHGAGWDKGFTLREETWANEVKQRWTETKWAQDNTNFAYPSNPRPTETNVYDKDGNRRRSTVAYASYGLPQDVTEYDANGTTVLRRTHTDYKLNAEYVDRRIIGLPDEQTMYGRDSLDGTEKLYSKVKYVYDEGGDFITNVSPLQHDNLNYSSSFVVGRGLLTSVRRYDVINGDYDESKSGYDAAGNVVFARQPGESSAHQTSIEYADSFDDAVNHSAYAYPTKVTDADGKESTAKYRYDIGAVTFTHNPKGAETTTEYDGVGRAKKVVSNSGAQSRVEYPANLMVVNSYTKLEATTESYAAKVFDGAGRVIATARDLPGSQGGYSGQTTTYDVMGRAVGQTNPTEISMTNSAPVTGAGDVATWTAVGDDVAGWHTSTQTYDWKGRPLVSTNTDGTTKEISYGGCGCAGGEVTTVLDEVGRKQKTFADALGRIVKAQVLKKDDNDPTLYNVYSTTSTTYNARDQVIKVIEAAGESATGQTTTITYDGHGRVQSKQSPIESAANTYSYNPDDTVNVATDARGVTATYSYNRRRQVTGINYAAPAGVAATAPVGFDYDAVGNRLWMTDGSGRVDYNFDTWSRLKLETRQFAGLAGSFPLTYDYNLAGKLRSVTDPFNATTNYTYDKAGQLTDVTGAGQGSFPQYASGMQYRAWGDIKQLTYGNVNNGHSHKLKVEYNARLQPSRFEVSGGGPYGLNRVMKAEFQYHDDGRIRYMHDLEDDKFDRAYQYDHVGRLVEASSGGRARGISNFDGPYDQSYGYDVWDNMVSRDNRFWSRQLDSYTPTYVNNRNQAWQYDAAGNVIRDESRQYGYDAAGRNTHVLEDQSTSVYTLSIDQSFDDDGRQIRRTSTERYPRSAPPYITTMYFVRSSVLGGAVITELNESGQKQKGYVYAGKQVLAEYWTNRVLWMHHDPVTGSLVETDASGVVVNVEELDPLGAGVGTSDPYINNNDPDYAGINQGSQLYFSSGNPFDVGRGCTADGAPISCSSVMNIVNSGAGVVAPAQTTAAIYNPHTGQTEIAFFRAYADGYQGFMPVGSEYFGKGNFRSLGAGDRSNEHLSLSSDVMFAQGLHFAPPQTTQQNNPCDLNGIEVPSGVDVNRNIAEAEKVNHDYWFAESKLSWLYDKVRNAHGRVDDVRSGKSWDYKQLNTRPQQYDAFGNFNYGAVGAVISQSDKLLLSEAGRAQQKAGTSKPEWGYPAKIPGTTIGGQPPYGDDPEDQKMIQRGINYYRSGCNKPKH